MHGGADGSAAKKYPTGFGPGHAGAVADMTVSYVSGGSRRRLTGFTVEAKEAGKPPVGKQAAARNAAIAAVLAAEKAAPEKLSPDVEVQARRIGRAVGEKLVAYAKEQGWIAAPQATASAGRAGETAASQAGAEAQTEGGQARDLISARRAAP